MSIHAGPKTAFEALKDGSVGSYWSPKILKSLWADTAGTIPATVDQEVKRMDDLGPLENHMLAPTGTRTISGYTYTFKGPVLRKEDNQYYLEFDGDGAGLRALSAKGGWSSVDATGSTAISLSVAFQTDSDQPSLPSSGLGGTWLGSDSLGNFGSVWWFGLRLSSEIMFYATVRNSENTLWVSQWNDDNRYSTLTSAQYLDTKVIYTAYGTIDNATFGGGDYINGQESTRFTNIPFNATTELPVPFANSLAIGARSPGNDNWIKGRFYGGLMVNKLISEKERIAIERFLYISCYN